MDNVTVGDHAFTASNGLTFTYTVRGKTNPTNGPILVQCPTWGIGSRYLEIGLSPLESDFTMIYFHPRGTAGSSRPESATEMSCFDMAEDLEQFRQHLQVDQFPAILGHSQGGTIALSFAELYPSRVAKIVLLDHRLLGCDDSTEFKRFREERRGDARYDEAYETLLHDRPRTDEDLAASIPKIAPMYFYDPDKYVPVFLEALGSGPVSMWNYESTRASYHDPDLVRRTLDGLKSVTAKVLMVFGRQDGQCTVLNATETRRRIPHAEIVLIDQCGHYPWIEKPRETFSVLKRFLDSR